MTSDGDGLADWYPPAVVPGPSVRLLGRLVFEGWSSQPTASYVTELVAYLAVTGRPVPADTLRTVLSHSSDTVLAKGTLRNYIATARSHLEPAGTITHSAGGYQLDNVLTDTAVFSALCDSAALAGLSLAARAEQCGQALALVGGPPLHQAGYDWHTDPEITAIAAMIRQVALDLADRTMTVRPALARWACHQALNADPTSAALNARALDAAKATRGPGALHDEWAATARRYQPSLLAVPADLETHYHRLNTSSD